MTIAGLTENAGSSRLPSLGPATGFGETVGASLTDAWVNSPMGALQYREIPLVNRDRLYKQRFGVDVWEATGLKDKRIPLGPSQGYKDLSPEKNQALDALIVQGRKDSPALYDGFLTTDEIQKNAMKIINRNDAFLNETMLRNPSEFSRFSGGFVGGAAALMANPVNAAAMFMGAGPVKAGLGGMGTATAIMRAAMIDGTMQAAVTGSMIPQTAEWQNSLGKRYGFGEAASEIALAGFGGAAMSGVARAVLPVFRGSVQKMGSVSSYILDRVAASEKLPPSVRDAAAYLSRVAHIDESASPGSIRNIDDLAAHREQVAGVVEGYEKYSPVPEGPPQRMLDYIQSQLDAVKGAANTAKPILQWIKDKGGLNINSPVSAELRSMDITPKSSVGLFRKEGGIGDLDNIPVTEFNEKFGTNAPDGGNGYVDRNWLIEQIRKESFGTSDKAAQEFEATLAKHDLDANSTPRQVYDALYAKPELDDHISQIARELKVNLSHNDIEGVKQTMQEYPGYDLRDAVDEYLERAAIKGDYSSRPLDMASPDRLADAYSVNVPEEEALMTHETDFDAVLEQMGDEKISLDDGREVTAKQFAKEMQGRKNMIEAMKTCRVK